MTAQIIAFPNKGKPPTKQPPTIDESQTAVDTMKSQHINETLLTVSPMLFERLYAAGFDFSDFKSDDELKYGSYVVEALHSLLCKYYDLYHPFQTVAEQIFVKSPETNQLQVTDEIHIKFIDKSKTP